MVLLYETIINQSDLDIFTYWPSYHHDYSNNLSTYYENIKTGLWNKKYIDRTSDENGLVIKYFRNIFQ